MNRLKLLRFLFALFLVLAMVFGIGLLIPDMKESVLGRIGLWSGFIAQLLLAAAMYSEIKRYKNGQDS